MNLKEFCDSIDFEAIKEFVGTRRHEDLHLDFKTAPNGFDKDARKNFAKALSGFANSDGGIIVWGVLAKQGKDGDAADKLDPIHHLGKFLSELNSYTGQYVSPLVDGVEHRLIHDPTLRDSGYAVSLVPVSDVGPHMAKGGEDRYYKRSGDSFYKLEHYEVADLFGRRPQAHLTLHYRLHKSVRRVSVEIGIINSGRGMAHYPYLELEVNPPYEIGSLGVVQGASINSMTVLQVPGFSVQHMAFSASGHSVIYPQGILLIAKIELRLPQTENYTIPDLNLSYTICCEGVPMKDGKTSISGTEFESAAIS